MSTNVPIASVTLSAATPSVVFSGIPQTYTDLFLVCNIGQSASNNSLRIRYNSDTGSNYSYTTLVGNGSSTYSGRDVNLTCGLVAETTASANIDLTVIANIQNYSNSTTYKTHIGRGNRADGTIDAVVGLWRSISAITSIELAMGSGFPSNNFASGSTFNLYGINAANSGQAKATGGDSIYRDASYWYHVFNKSGTFTPAQNLSNVDYLVVAGGGGGGRGQGQGGGGGAGGVRCTLDATGGGGSLEAKLSLTASVGYTVTIGAGGIGGTSNDSSPAASGSNSVFGSITSNGGGGGGNWTSAGGSGGSGGGTSAGLTQGTAGGAASPSGQGYPGGANGTVGQAGGGGGAGAAGGNGSSSSNGASGSGGNGIQTSISGTATYYGGGGAGAGYLGTAGSAGLGGGGSSDIDGQNLATAGTANTGGGGGGKAQGNGKNGGSGIIIVRYPV